jgi:surface antigen
MNRIKLSALAIVLAMMAACGPKTETWTSLMPDATFSNWRTVNDEPDAEASSEEIVISGDKVMVYAPADTEAPLPLFRNFVLRAQVLTTAGTASSLWFHHADRQFGYEIALGNKRLDAGRLRGGSLVNVRNIYKRVVPEGEWFDLEVTVNGKQITVKVGGELLVDYVEPAQPYRVMEDMARLSAGTFVIDNYEGTTRVRGMEVQKLPDDAAGRTDAVDETTDRVIRLTQNGFPVIDNHVHLKGWSQAEAMENSRRTGIFYTIAPNCGIGFPITDDAGIDTFLDTTRTVVAFRAMQGEGREWPTTFAASSREKFDFVFTDALTFTDHAGRRVRLWIDEEVIIDVPREQYMDQIVEATVGVISGEPIDVFVNPFFLPTAMTGDYEALWTDARVARVVAALVEKGVALEVNARYRIPSARIIKAAMEAGVKLSFGTNNADPNMGALEYCFEMVDECGITPENMFFPENL